MIKYLLPIVLELITLVIILLVFYNNNSRAHLRLNSVIILIIHFVAILSCPTVGHTELVFYLILTSVLLLILSLILNVYAKTADLELTFLFGFFLANISTFIVVLNECIRAELLPIT